MTKRFPPQPRFRELGILIAISAIMVGVVKGHASAVSGYPHAAPTVLHRHPPLSRSFTPASRKGGRGTCHLLKGVPYGNGGVSYLPGDLRRVQAEVDGRRRCVLYYLNPVAVTLRDLPQYGYAGKALTLLSPPSTAPRVVPTAHHGEDGLPETDVIVTYRGHRLWIVLNQFERRGPHGIWAIITITSY